MKPHVLHIASGLSPDFATCYRSGQSRAPGSAGQTRRRGLQVFLNATVYAAAAATVVSVPLMLTAPVGDTLARDISVEMRPPVAPKAAIPPEVAQIFGQPDRPDTPPVVETRSVADPGPALSYTIKGLVLSADRNWAVLGSPQRDEVVSPGDVLDSGAFVDRIDADGVHLVLDGAKTLVRPEQMTRTVAPSASPEPLAEEPAAEVVFRIGRLDAAEVARLIARGGRLGPRSEVVGGIPVTWVRAGEFLDRLGLAVGDVIVSVENAPVSTLSDALIGQSAVKNDGRVVFEVRTGDERRRILVRFAKT